MNSWFHSAIIYHIFIDRFYGFKAGSTPFNSQFCGGNFTGVINKLNFIKNLGANTIWLSPFFESSAYHGYHITDFKKTDHRFGTVEQLKQLIAKCKESDLKVITDIVPNHCSNKHPWFKDAIASSASSYRNWFYINNKNNNYQDFMGFKELPKLNLENPETANWLIECFCDWARLGIDGFRIDHVLGIPDDFLVKLRSKLKALNPDFILIGEAWGDGMKHKYLKTLKIEGKTRLWQNGFKQIDIQKHYDGILDGVLDFGWRNLLFENIEAIKHTPGRFAAKSLSYSKKYSPDFLLPRFLDNHDTSRIMHICENDSKLLEDLIKILFSQEQPVIIYYGTEAGLTHAFDVNQSTSDSDLNARSLIDWKNGEFPFEEIIRNQVFQRKKRYPTLN